MLSEFLDPIWALLGLGGLPKGPGIDSVSVGPSFRPNGRNLGPIGPLFVFEFPKNPVWAQIAPSPGWVQGPHGPRAPSNMDPRAHGGRRLTFRRGVGGGAPPLQRGGCRGGGRPPTEKWTLELFAIAKSGTLIWTISMSRAKPMKSRNKRHQR